MNNVTLELFCNVKKIAKDFSIKWVSTFHSFATLYEDEIFTNTFM